MARKKSAFEKNTFKLFLEFNNAAMDWGWTQDQGTGTRVDTSEKVYRAARVALEKRIKDLHTIRRRHEKLKSNLLDAEMRGDFDV